jgi:LysM repeat protein
MGAFIAKTIVILLVATVVFGGAAFYAWDLFIRPEQELKAEKNAPATPVPPDPAQPQFDAAKKILAADDLIAAREAFARFVEQNPHSRLLDQAKDILGKLNTTIFLTPMPAPEKQVYVVRPGDVLNKVARITKTTPDLLMKSNGMTGTMLRIDQKILYTPADFSLIISRKEKRITVLNRGRFFKQYPIKTLPAASAKKAPLPARQTGKIVEKIAWGPDGGRVIFSDPGYARATFWISHTVAGNTLYSDPDPGSPLQATKPPAGGLGLAPEDAAELAVLLSKGDAVTVEN